MTEIKIEKMTSDFWNDVAQIYKLGMEQNDIRQN